LLRLMMRKRGEELEAGLGLGEAGGPSALRGVRSNHVPGGLDPSPASQTPLELARSAHRWTHMLRSSSVLVSLTCMHG